MADPGWVWTDAAVAGLLDRLKADRLRLRDVRLIVPPVGLFCDRMMCVCSVPGQVASRESRPRRTPGAADGVSRP